MPDPRPLSAAVARRFLVIRHFLAPPRSLPPAEESVLAVVDRLGSLQFDPLEVAGRNHDLVLHARVDGYRRAWTDHLLYDRRLLFEAYNKGLSILPTRELPWHRLTWDRARRAHEDEIFREHGDHVAELLDRIRRDGPISTADLDRSEAIDWYWGPDPQVAGRPGGARRGRHPRDRAARRQPALLRPRRAPLPGRPPGRARARARAAAAPPAQPVPRPRPARARPARPRSSWASGRARRSPTDRRGRDARDLLAELVERGELVPVAVDGVRGVRHVVTDELPLLAQAEREVAEGHPPGGEPPTVTFLAPLDPLAWDRDLLRSLFGFDYLWEVYVPAAKRRWGYYVLPLLFGDRFVGRIEPRFERSSARGADPRPLVGGRASTRSPPTGSCRRSRRRSTRTAAFHGATRATFPRDRASRALAGALARRG